MTYRKINQPVGDQLRMAMRQWASGVGIATAEFEKVRHGMTVSSFTSVAVDPPIILISVQKDTRTHDLIVNSGSFAVTLLASDQQEISARFAGQMGDDEDRFVGLETTTLKTGSPVLLGGLAVFDCRLKDTYDAETTTVMFGAVVEARLADKPMGSLEPLLYHNRDYRRLT